MPPSRYEIENSRPTKAQLAEWGIRWPPKKGWRKKLLKAADRRDGTTAREAPSRIRVGPYKPGEKHRAWPEWTWDGRAFVKTRGGGSAIINRSGSFDM